MFILHHKNIAYLLLLIGLFFNTVVIAQDTGEEYSNTLDFPDYLEKDIEKHDFDKAAWNKVVKDLYYTEKVKKEKPRKQNFNTWNAAPSINSAIIKTFLIIVAIAILVFVIFKIFAGNYFMANTKIEKEAKVFNIEDVKENIKEVELDKMLKIALQQRLYKEAIRIYYLMIIKKLFVNNSIVWTKNKTNSEYLREMRKNSNFKIFSETTTIYEKIWFGDITVNETDFQKLKQIFENCITKMSY